MRAPRSVAAAGLATVLGLVLALGSPTTAVAATIMASTGDAGRVPVGLAALGAVLGVLAFGARQWWERPGRGRR